MADEPGDDRAGWDHEADVDIDLPDGRLVFEASGGGTPVPASVSPGTYRMRVPGRGYSLSVLPMDVGDDDPG